MRRLAAVALLALAVAGVARSGAAFVGALDEAPSTVAAGTLSLEAGASNRSPVDAAFMRPGGTRTGVVELRNAGTVDATLQARVGDIESDPAAAGLASILTLRLEDCGADATCGHPDVRYDGPLSGAGDGVALGALSADDSRHVRVTIAWPAGKADPSRQGATATAAVVWTAVAGESK